MKCDSKISASTFRTTIIGIIVLLILNIHSFAQNSHQFTQFGITVAGGNGFGSAANQLSVSSPGQIFIDSAGNLYIADYNNYRIQKWAPGATSGVTVAGGNGQGAAANQLNQAAGVFVDGAGNVYVADQNNHRVQKWAPGATSGVTVAGGNGSGTGADQLNGPLAIFVDVAGNMYIADSYNRRVQKWAPGATSGTTVAGSSTGIGGTAANLLGLPIDVRVDASGVIYLTDMSNSRVQKWGVGALSGVTIAGDSAGGWGAAANQLRAPTSAFVDAGGNVFVADANNYRVQEWHAGDTTGITLVGGNGAGSAANQMNPGGLVMDGAGNLFVGDFDNSRVMKFAPCTPVYTWENRTICAGSSYAGHSATGTYQDTYMATNGCDSIRSLDLTVGGTMPSVRIYQSTYQFCPGTVVSFHDSLEILQGNAPIYQWYKDGIAVGSNSPTYRDSTLQNGDSVWLAMTSNATCASPATVTSNVLYQNTYPVTPITLVDSGNNCQGNVLLTAYGAFDAITLNWQLNGTTIGTSSAYTIVAGGSIGSGPSDLDMPSDLIVDGSGNIYVADNGNSRVQKFSPGSNIGTTVAGGPTNPIIFPGRIALDASGNLYVLDFQNNGVQKWAPGASTGTMVAGGNGQGNAANQLNAAQGIFVDASGNLYIADAGNARVQKWTPGATTGITIAGGNGEGNASNQFAAAIADLWVDANANVYVLDLSNYRVQKWAPGASSGVTVAGGNGYGTAANQLQAATSIFMDNNQNIFLLDETKRIVQKWAPGATSGTTVLHVLGTDYLLSMYMDGNGSIYISTNAGDVRKYDMQSDSTYLAATLGNYQVEATDVYGCTYKSNIVAVGMVRDTLSETISQGQNYNGHTTTGTYLDTILATGGCDTLRTLYLTVIINNDSIVWPGDANSDGIANMYDILALGLAYNDTGSVRPSANNSWTGQLCPPWMNVFSTGVNHNHADCNGDGIVDANDTLPVLLNYLMTHAKTDEQQRTPGAPLLYYNIPPSDSLTVSTPYSIPVDLGVAPDTATNVYGIAFTIHYDSSLVQLNSTYFAASNSWLGTVNNNMLYIQKPTVPGQIDCAVTRTNHSSRSGIGTIGTFGFITIDNLSGKTHLVDTLHLSFSGIQMIDQNGNILPVNTQTTDLKITQDVDGIANVTPTFQLTLFPNPATNSIHYSVLGLVDKATYSIMDITGREMQVGEMAGKGLSSGTIDLVNYPMGVYVFRLSSAAGTAVRRIVIR